MRKFAILLGFAIAAGAVGPALALPVAYLFVERASGSPDDIPNGLGNCLALTHDFPEGTVVRLECDDLNYMNKALIDIGEKAGVTKLSVWTIRTE